MDLLLLTKLTMNSRFKSILASACLLLSTNLYPADFAVNKGWNLLANYRNSTIYPSSFSGKENIDSVWKWNHKENKWHFYTPRLTKQELLSYTVSKGYLMMDSILPMEGMWINSKVAYELIVGVETPPGVGTEQFTIEKDLIPGWVLTGVTSYTTPKALGEHLRYYMSLDNKEVKSIWGWDPINTKWKFYTPLYSESELKDYNIKRQYLDFNVFEANEGVWINSSGYTSNRKDAVRPLPADFSTRKAINYSPFRTANENSYRYQTTTIDGEWTPILDFDGKCILNMLDITNEVITDDMILQDLRLITLAGFSMIRLFDSTDNVAARVMRVIRNNHLDIKVFLGSYIHGYPYTLVDNKCKIAIATEYNQEELYRAMKLANEYQDIVVAVSVGNENLATWSTNKLDPVTLAKYLSVVRNGITQPVTSDDHWTVYSSLNETNSADAVIRAIDFVTVHFYPFLDTIYNHWYWKMEGTDESIRAVTMMNEALGIMKYNYSQVYTYLNDRTPGGLPIAIGETGWKSAGLEYRAHPVNQKMYFERVRDWANSSIGLLTEPKAIFHFVAFDEPWKGTDNNWGFFTTYRQAKWLLHDLPITDSIWTVVPDVYKDSDAVYYKPPVTDPTPPEVK